jgi:hypothetical protein
MVVFVSRWYGGANWVRADLVYINNAAKDIAQVFIALVSESHSAIIRVVKALRDRQGLISATESIIYLCFIQYQII